VDKVLTSANHSLITNLLDQNIVGTDILVNDENALSPNETQFPLGESLSGGVRTADSHGNHWEPTTAENQGFIHNGDAGYVTVRAIKPTNTIGLEAARRLLPSSFNGEKQEDTEVFFWKNVSLQSRVQVKQHDQDYYKVSSCD